MKWNRKMIGTAASVIAIGIVTYSVVMTTANNKTSTIAHKPINEKSAVHSAKEALAKHQIVIPEKSLPKVGHDAEGLVLVEFMHASPPQPGEYRGDNLGAVHLNPESLSPVRIMGPGD